jgi:ribose 5-phosphate isomerase A
MFSLLHQLDVVLAADPGDYLARRHLQSNSGGTIEEAKRAAAVFAVDKYVSSNMVVGLGTGSTAKYAVERIAERIKNREISGVTGVPTSKETETLAQELDIPLSDLNRLTKANTNGYLIDVAIDGADAVDCCMNLIKGGGAALLREKMVEKATEKFVCIVDQSKMVEYFGGFSSAVPLPVEIVKFSHEHVIRVITRVLNYHGCTVSQRFKKDEASGAETPVVTDNGNYIADVRSPGRRLLVPGNIAADLEKITGVVEHGLFCGMAKVIVVAKQDGTIEEITTPKPGPHALNPPRR